MSRGLLRSLSAAILLSLSIGLPAFAYDGEVEVQVDVSGPSRAVCPTAVSATVTVVDRDGNPLVGVPVTWSTGATGTTDASGQHTISVALATSLTVTASAQGATGTLVIQCVAGEVLGSVGLPRTSTVPGTASGELPALLGFAVLAGLVLARRRGSARA